MKMYLTHDQTAKLIELGLPKPKMAAPALKWVDGEPTFEPQYTIGELIEMLPRVYISCEIIYVLNIEAWDNHKGWDVQYFDGIDTIAHYTPANELIDALWIMIVKLKEEGVI